MYKKGDYEEAHYHKIATDEGSLTQSDRVRMVGRKWHCGDIIVLNPRGTTDVTALKASICMVVKTLGSMDDKFLGNQI